MLMRSICSQSLTMMEGIFPLIGIEQKQKKCYITGVGLVVIVFQNEIKIVYLDHYIGFLGLFFFVGLFLMSKKKSCTPCSPTKLLQPPYMKKTDTKSKKRHK